MAIRKRLPQTLLEAVRYFQDADTCVEFVAGLRWPNGPVCPSCEGNEHSYLTTRRLWKCKACKRQFSVKVGTIFEDSPIPLDKWLAAIWIIANSKNGVSSHELGRSIGLTQKSSWFVLHRIRLAMQTGSFDRFTGEVEVDESFIGGKAKFMHKDVRKRKIGGTGGKDKTAILGVRMRDTGRIRAEVLPSCKRAMLQARVRHRVEAGASVYTDALQSYDGLNAEYDHAVIDHAEKCVDGRVHVNGVENFWSLLKRGINGTYVSVAPFHLFRYLDERVFTFNERNRNDFGRFAVVLAAVSGRRLTYAGLTGKA